MNIVMMTLDPIVDRRIIAESMSLIEDGWNVHIICSQPIEGYPLEEDQFPQLTITRIDGEKADAISKSGVVDMERFAKIMCSVPKVSWELITPAWAYALMQALPLNADVYMAHDLPMLPLATIAAMYNNSWCAYDAHELYFEQVGFGRKQNRLLERVEKWCIALVDEVFTVNQSIAEEMKKREAIPEPTVILNAPYLTSPIHNNKTKRLHQMCGISEDKRIVLYHGNYSLERNLGVLVESFQFVTDPSAHLVLIGHDWTNEEVIRQALQLIIEKHNLENRVSLLKPVLQAELLDVVLSASVGVIPYLPHEVNNFFCTPNKLFDFLVTGTPILATDLPELKRFVSDQGVGINTSMANNISIAQGINEILGDNYNMYFKQAQEVAPTYLWNNQGKKIVDKFTRFKTRIRPPEEYWIAKLAELEVRRGNLIKAVDVLFQIS